MVVKNFLAVITSPPAPLEKKKLAPSRAKRFWSDDCLEYSVAIVREIAELHAAAVRIDANPSGRGARVTVQFSAQQQAAKPLKAHVS